MKYSLYNMIDKPWDWQDIHNCNTNQFSFKCSQVGLIEVTHPEQDIPIASMCWQTLISVRFVPLLMSFGHAVGRKDERPDCEIAWPVAQGPHRRVVESLVVLIHHDGWQETYQVRFMYFIYTLNMNILVYLLHKLEIYCQIYIRTSAL